LYAIIAQRTIQNLELPPGTTVAEVTIDKLFLGGIGPGVLLVVRTTFWAMFAGPKLAADRPRFKWREAGAAVWDAKWELALPALVLGAMFSGLATTVEAAAIAAL